MPITLKPHNVETYEKVNENEDELQQIIANNDQTIEENSTAIKKALVQRILAQQKTISEQQSEIGKLSRQKREEI